MDMNEINEKQDGILIFVSIVGIMLFIALLMSAFDQHKKRNNEVMLIALFFCIFSFTNSYWSKFCH